MYKDDYISAFGKLAPSEEWMTDTLAKMRAAEAEQEAPGAAGPVGRPALRVSGKKHPRLRRAALPVAAAVRCGGSAGDNGGRAGRRAQGGQAAVRRGRRRYGHGRYYRPDGCGPGGREPHL